MPPFSSGAFVTGGEVVTCGAGVGVSTVVVVVVVLRVVAAVVTAVAPSSLMGL